MVAPERYLTAQDVSARLNSMISVKTLANWRCDPAAKGPPYAKFGNRIVYPETRFEEWLAQRHYRSTSQRADAPTAQAA